MDEKIIQISLAVSDKDPLFVWALTNFGRILARDYFSGKWIEIELPDLVKSKNIK